MLTEEVLALLESRIVRANLRGVMVEVQPDILDELISEVRRLRAEAERRDTENAELKRELTDFRAFYEESKPVIDDVHEYVQAHKIGIGGQDVVRILLEDAVRLRSVVKGLLDTKDPLFVLGFGTPDAAPVDNAGAREIAVGDRVRITEGFYKGRDGLVVSDLTNTALTHTATVDIGSARITCPIAWLEKL